MFESILTGGVSKLVEYVILGAIALVVLSYVWPYLKATIVKFWPSASGSSILSGIDNAIINIDEINARVALANAAALFTKHGDAESAATLKGLVTKAVVWSEQEKK